MEICVGCGKLVERRWPPAPCPACGGWDQQEAGLCRVCGGAFPAWDGAVFYEGFCRGCVEETLDLGLAIGYFDAYGLWGAFGESGLPMKEFCLADWTHLAAWMASERKASPPKSDTPVTQSKSAKCQG